jgi:drug/metabolite transporter (DMT)-like permease
MAGTRFVIAGLGTFAILRARGVALPNRLQLRSLVIVGAFLLVGGNGLVTWSEQQVPSGIAALVVATVPLWIAIFDWLLFKNGKPGRQTVVGLILGFIGIVMLIGPEQIGGRATFDMLSLLILILAPILWSMGSLYSRTANMPENVFMSTAVEMLAGGFLLLIAGLLTGETTKLDFDQVSTNSLLAMIYLTIAGSIIAFTAYIWLLKRVPAARVATYTYVNPVIAVFLGWLILSEPFSPQILAAAVIIILAVVLITTQKPKRETSQIESAPNQPAITSETPTIRD